MIGDYLWTRNEVRRLTEVSARMLAAHHRAEGQLTVYRMIVAAQEAQQEAENASSGERISSPDDTEPSVRLDESTVRNNG